MTATIKDHTGQLVAVGDVLLSNDGKGPLRAEVLGITDKSVMLQHGRKQYTRSAVLSRRFFQSRNCGWIKAVSQ